jgi:type IV pilus assembly protein PilY1
MKRNTNRPVLSTDVVCCGGMGSRPTAIATAVVHFILTILVIGGTVVGPAAAQVEDFCQVPLSIQKGAVNANIMILFDNSGSMNEAVEHANYQPGVEYTGGYVVAATYLITPSGTRTTNGVDAYLVEAPNAQAGRYSGNYLNWIFYHATPEEVLAIPRETKMEVAQTAIKAFIDRGEAVNMGLAKFNGQDGAVVVAECGTDPATLQAEVDLLAGDSSTPLGEAMEDMLDYFIRTDSGAPIQYDCQKSFIVVMTDGWPTFDLDVSAYLQDADGDGKDPGDCASIGAPYDNAYDCSDHMDDVADWMRRHDLIDWLGEEGEAWEDGQTVVTYTIGYDVNHTLLEDTALNGDGLYLPVNDSAELWASLEAIMVNIRRRVAAGAAVAVVSSESSDADFLFRGKYNPVEWMGFVECFEQPYEDKERPVWEAGEILASRDADTREIFTNCNGHTYQFDEGNAGALMTELGLSDADSAAALIKWTRGDEVAGLRVRNLGWKLGDIVHSAPVVVGSPTFFSTSSSSEDFFTATTAREKVLYVGSNDGMLHAFRASDGYEKWAFIPEFALEQLAHKADPTYCHEFSVDLTPAVRDCKVNGSWRTVLVCGARRGGADYFALDVTDPDDPSVLWQMKTPDDMAWSSEVQFATLDDEAVFLVGSGYDMTGGKAYLYAFDLATGAELGAQELSSVPGSRNKATAPAPVDVNFDGETDVAYVGDLRGTMHRVVFNGSSNDGSWTMTELYSGSQPITAQPKAAYGEGGLMMVYFGTGWYLEPTDILDLSQQSFYCVMDRHDGASNPSLVNQTSKVKDIGNADGWYIDLIEDVGERVTEPATVAAEAVFFTSYAPFQQPCRSGGESFFYRLEYDTGGNVEMEDDGPGNFQRKFRGGGIASRPVLDVINGQVIIQNSNQTISVEEIGKAYMVMNVKSWQEDFSSVIDGQEDGDQEDDGDGSEDIQ